MSPNPERPLVPQDPVWKPLVIALVVGLAIWGGYLAIGASLGGVGRENAAADWRRGLVVFSFVLVFIGIIWLAMHSKRRPPAARKDEDET